MVGVSYGGALALALGYLLGSIPFGLVLTKLAGAGDLRSIGSGQHRRDQCPAHRSQGACGCDARARRAEGDAGHRFGVVVVWTADGAGGGGRRDPRPHVSGLAQVPRRQGRRDLSRRAHRPCVAGGDRIRRRLARGRGAHPLLLGGGAHGDGCFSDRHGRDWRERRGFGLRRAVSAGLVQAQRQHRPASQWLRDENRAEELEWMANKPELRLTDQQRFDWLRLIRSENVGPRTFRALITNCGGVASGAERAAGARAARRREAPDPRRFGRRGRKRAHRRSQTRGPLRRPRRAGLSAGAAGDRFRAANSRSSRPRGGVAQGGGRNRRLPQRFRCGTDVRRAAGARLGQAGYVIVSGLARGIDQRAHVASLETGAVGVLAGGHGKPYPSEAVPLMERMVEVGRGPVRNADRMGAARARLSAPQSHRLRTRLRRRGGRGGAGFGLAHHGAIRARAKPSGLRRARFSPRSARRRNQRSPEARGVDLHRRGRRADGARASALGR